MNHMMNPVSNPNGVVNINQNYNELSDTFCDIFGNPSDKYSKSLFGKNIYCAYFCN